MEPPGKPGRFIWDVSGKANLYTKKVTEPRGPLGGCNLDAGAEGGTDSGADVGAALDAGPDLYLVDAAPADAGTADAAAPDTAAPDTAAPDTAAPSP